MNEKDGLHINELGTKRWFKDGKLHRYDGPAVIRSDGEQWWYKNDKIHRDDGPAGIFPDGTQYWFKNGLVHRDGGPAIICADDTHYWYKDDQPYEPSAHDLMVWKMNERRTLH